MFHYFIYNSKLYLIKYIYRYDISIIDTLIIVLNLKIERKKGKKSKFLSKNNKTIPFLM